MEAVVTRAAPTLFLSAGEPSGDLHGASLIRALRGRRPDLRFEGFGGTRMADEGCHLHYPLSHHAAGGFFRILAELRLFIRLVGQATRVFERQRPDAVVLIDFPGFNWWIARRAHENRIPVVYFVPPQLWAWANWRAYKMRRWVDRVLCTLPFEEAWLRARRVKAEYIGHPYFDALHGQQLDLDFLEPHQKHRGPIVALLPGSRSFELRENIETQVRAAERIHRERPDVRFLVACYKREHAEYITRRIAELRPTRPERTRGPFSQGHHGGWDLPLEVCAGRTAEVLHLAHSCMSVSGSVSLELLFYGVPSTVMYQTNRRSLWLFNRLRTVPYIGLVNLLAGREVFPEYLTAHSEADAISRHVLRWLNEPAAAQALRDQLRQLREQVAQPGACERAADRILDLLG